MELKYLVNIWMDGWMDEYAFIECLIVLDVIMPFWNGLFFNLS